MIFFVTLGFKTSQWTVARGESETCKLMLHVSILCFNMSIKSLEICTAVQAVILLFQGFTVVHLVVVILQ